MIVGAMLLGGVILPRLVWQRYRRRPVPEGFHREREKERKRKGTENHVLRDSAAWFSAPGLLGLSADASTQHRGRNPNAYEVIEIF